MLASKLVLSIYLLLVCVLLMDKLFFWICCSLIQDFTFELKSGFSKTRGNNNHLLGRGGRFSSAACSFYTSLFLWERKHHSLVANWKTSYMFEIGQESTESAALLSIKKIQFLLVCILKNVKWTHEYPTENNLGVLLFWELIEARISQQTCTCSFWCWMWCANCSFVYIFLPQMKVLNKFTWTGTKYIQLILRLSLVPAQLRTTWVFCFFGS